jgi:hypothetical protein
MKTIGNLLIILQVLNPSDANGFTELNTTNMVKLKNIKHDLWLKVLHSRKAFIMRKLLLLLLNGIPSD